VAAVEAAESRHALRAICLLAVLVSAKTITLLGRPIALSGWSPFAYFWQDVCVALVFLAIDRAVGRPLPAWIAYAVITAYAALNVPIVLELSTPLTWTMIRAARGPLADGVRHAATAVNLLALGVSVALAIGFPFLIGRHQLRIRPWTIAIAAITVAIGPLAVSRVNTLGLHRNAIGALVSTGLPRVEPLAAERDWRASPFSRPPGADLSSLRGSMRGKNVLLVVLESTGARHLKTYGAAIDPMPNLTALSRRSIVVERAYAVYPESIKGLFATLCARYPAFDTAPEVYADVPCAPLPRILSQAGYRTALFHSGRFDYLGMRAMIDRRGFDLLEDAGAIGGQVDSSFGVDDASTVQHVLRWVASLKGQRFFLTYLPIAGHHPYEATRPGPFRGRDDFTRYLNSLHESDAALGALLEGLRALGLDDDTVVIVFGDHGEAFGEHPGNFAHTLFIHEENVRVPYVIALPGAVAQERRLPQIASVIDTGPTILDLLGLPLDGLHHGGSLLRPEPRMALFFTDYSLGWLGLVDGCWKYVYELDAGRSRLYDICTDPQESSDRAAAFPAQVSAYRDRLQAWAAAQKEAVRR
jgi:glucan phosphoethanolaminetransferase (alkaline phosphatase superfamily)